MHLRDPERARDRGQVLALVRDCMADLRGQGMSIPRTYVLVDGDAHARYY